MKTLSLHIKNKSLAQEAVNCWLRYTLSQPISIDISILLLFAIQYFGLNRIAFLLEHTQKLMSSIFRLIADRIWLSDPVTYGLERA